MGTVFKFFRQGGALLLVVAALLACNSLSAPRAKATDLPTIHKSGTLSSSETWTTGAVYIIDGSVTVQYGATLTIDAGTIVKLNGVTWDSSIRLGPDGTLNVEGSYSSRVIFTSYSDDSLGGDSNNDGSLTSPTQNSYGTLVVANSDSSSVSMQFTEVKYATNTLSCYQQNNANIELADNSFDAPVQIEGCNDVGMVRNAFNVSGAYGMRIINSRPTGIVLSGSDTNSFSGSSQGQGVLVSTTLNIGDSWTISGDSGATFVVPGITVRGELTIDPGTNVKFDGNQANIYVDSGILNISGTSSSRVTFTSLRDDSVSGDTPNDGASQVGATDYSRAIRTNTGTVTVAYANFLGGRTAVDHYCDYAQAATIIVNDSFLKGGINTNGCGTTISLQRNVFNLDTETALRLSRIDLSDIVLAGNDKNTFTGNGKGKYVETYDSKVASDKSWSVDGDSGAILGLNALTVMGTLNLNSGSVVKMDGTYPIKIDGGTLNVVGTGLSPATFTSLKDDTQGGDTNGDNTSSAPATNDYLAAIQPKGSGVVSLSHANFKYGQYAVYSGYCDSYVPEGAHLSIEDSQFSTGISTGNCRTADISLVRNQFNVNNGPAMTIGGVDPSDIILSGSNKNTFSGSARSRVIELTSASILTGSEWIVDGATGVTLMPYGHMEVFGSLLLTNGVVVKLPNSSSIHENAGGSIESQGASGLPVVITSARDDIVVGDSNGDGSTNGGLGDYIYAFNSDAASALNLNFTTIKYASTALNLRNNASVSNVTIQNSSTGLISTGNSKVNLASTTIKDVNTGIANSDNSQVTFRGNFQNIASKAITSCSWSSSCSVDATYTDWDSAAGPEPTSGNLVLVCGAVLVTPWLDGSSVVQGAGVWRNCDGSYTPVQSLTNAASNFQDRINDKEIDCSGGFHDACVAIDTAYACLGGARDVANSTSPWPLPPASTAQEVNALGGLILDSASTYLSGQATPTVSGFAFPLLVKGLGVASTMITMANAYNQCAP